MKIITISREFGSGGRELGKRLADALGISCYDHQIIEMVAEKEYLTKEYVLSKSEKEISFFYPTTIARGFTRRNYAVIQTPMIVSAELETLKKLASEGPCVIIGRAADIVLSEQNPFRIFVCADDESKISRCRERAKAEEGLSDSEMLKKCREIDKRRIAYRKMFTDKKWSDASSYELCINTSGKEIKDLIPSVVEYINSWYGEE